MGSTEHACNTWGCQEEDKWAGVVADTLAPPPNMAAVRGNPLHRGSVSSRGWGARVPVLMGNPDQRISRLEADTSRQGALKGVACLAKYCMLCTVAGRERIRDIVGHNCSYQKTRFSGLSWSGCRRASWEHVRSIWCYYNKRWCFG